MANKVRNARGLTAQMEEFCYALVYGVDGKPTTQAGAYRHAYDASTMHRAQVDQQASRLVTQDRIAKRVEQLRGKREAYMRAQAAGDAERVREFLRSVIAGEQRASAQQVRAAELLGKASPGGMFTDRQMHDAMPEGTPEQQRERLLARLRELAGEDEPTIPQANGSTEGSSNGSDSDGDTEGKHPVH